MIYGGVHLQTAVRRPDCASQCQSRSALNCIRLFLRHNSISRFFMRCVYTIKQLFIHLLAYCCRTHNSVSVSQRVQCLSVTRETCCHVPVTRCLFAGHMHCVGNYVHCHNLGKSVWGVSLGWARDVLGNL